MGLHHDIDDSHLFSEHGQEDNSSEIDQKRRVRKLLEDHLERKRLKEEFKDEFDDSADEFDWDEIEKDE